MAKNQATDIPASCGEAWIKYFLDNNLAGGAHTHELATLQATFDAGWDAAFAAFMKDSPDVR
jgi:hypothetical protein